MRTFYTVVVMLGLTSTVRLARDADAGEETTTIRAEHVFDDPKTISLCRAIELRRHVDVEAAIRAGANVKDSGRFGVTPLHWALHCAQCELDDAKVAGYVPVVRTLLRHGADPNVVGHAEPDEFVARLNEQLVVKVTRYGFIVPEGAAPTHVAAGSARSGDEFLELLMAYGADPNRRSAGRGRKTPLHWASTCGSVDSIQVLLEAKADVALADGHGAGALDLVTRWQVAVPLLEAGAPFDPKFAGASPVRTDDDRSLEQLATPFLARVVLHYDANLARRLDRENDGGDRRELAAFWKSVSILEQHGIDVAAIHERFSASLEQ